MSKVLNQILVLYRDPEYLIKNTAVTNVHTGREPGQDVMSAALPSLLAETA